MRDALPTASQAERWGLLYARMAELLLGIALIVGIRLRWAALASALLLLLFGLAMAISFGIKSPLDYSVFSASAAAGLLFALSQPGESGAKS